MNVKTVKFMELFLLINYNMQAVAAELGGGHGPHFSKVPIPPTLFACVKRLHS